MATDIHIPAAVLEAGKKELYPHLITENDDLAYEIARAALNAMVKAWPGMTGLCYGGGGVWVKGDAEALLLPIPSPTAGETE